MNSGPLVVAAILLLGVICVFTSPVPVADSELATELKLEDHFATLELAAANLRQKRATCDVLSIFNVNHTACALHCIAIGKGGGWCDDRKVCNCR